VTPVLHRKKRNFVDNIIDYIIVEVASVQITIRLRGHDPKHNPPPPLVLTLKQIYVDVTDSMYNIVKNIEDLIKANKGSPNVLLCVRTCVGAVRHTEPFKTDIAPFALNRSRWLLAAPLSCRR
jgi:hypothetical protein